MSRAWVRDAILALRRDHARSADTHLIHLPLARYPGIDLYLKDESIHPSGSLKHRLARSLFLRGLCDGHIHEGTLIVEASSGSTAISEAFFARLLGLPFLAVAPEGTAPAKLAAIAQAGGRLHLAPAGADICVVAAQIAQEANGCFMDQFTFAERATDWRGNNNIAESMFKQMAQEPHPAPRWVVVGAGTGGTSATIGRYVRYQPELSGTQVCVVDPKGSAFFKGYRDRDWSVAGAVSPIVEGIGRPRVEPSFIASVVDRMISVPDAASVAGARWLHGHLGRRFGPSTGTNLIGAMALAAEMVVAGERGSIVTLACDGGERYSDTVYCDHWLAARGVCFRAWMDFLERGGAQDWAGRLESAAH
ncbi:MAG: PLP-dependent cysteine synthase family protein [Caulobacterales bacterium]